MKEECPPDLLMWMYECMKAIHEYLQKQWQARKKFIEKRRQMYHHVSTKDYHHLFKVQKTVKEMETKHMDAEPSITNPTTEEFGPKPYSKDETALTNLLNEMNDVKENYWWCHVMMDLLLLTLSHQMIRDGMVVPLTVSMEEKSLPSTTNKQLVLQSQPWSNLNVTLVYPDMFAGLVEEISKLYLQWFHEYLTEDTYRKVFESYFLAIKSSDEKKQFNLKHIRLEEIDEFVPIQMQLSQYLLAQSHWKSIHYDTGANNKHDENEENNNWEVDDEEEEIEENDYFDHNDDDNYYQEYYDEDQEWEEFGGTSNDWNFYLPKEKNDSQTQNPMWVAQAMKYPEMLHCALWSHLAYSHAQYSSSSRAVTGKWINGATQNEATTLREEAKGQANSIHPEEAHSKNDGNSVDVIPEYMQESQVGYLSDSDQSSNASHRMIEYGIAEIFLGKCKRDQEIKNEFSVPEIRGVMQSLSGLMYQLVHRYPQTFTQVEIEKDSHENKADQQTSTNESIEMSERNDKQYKYSRKLKENIWRMLEPAVHNTYFEDLRPSFTDGWKRLVGIIPQKEWLEDEFKINRNFSVVKHSLNVLCQLRKGMEFHKESRKASYETFDNAWNLMPDARESDLEKRFYNDLDEAAQIPISNETEAGMLIDGVELAKWHKSLENHWNLLMRQTYECVLHALSHISDEELLTYLVINKKLEQEQQILEWPKLQQLCECLFDLANERGEYFFIARLIKILNNDKLHVGRPKQNANDIDDNKYESGKTGQRTVQVLIEQLREEMQESIGRLDKRHPRRMLEKWGSLWTSLSNANEQNINLMFEIINTHLDYCADRSTSTNFVHGILEHYDNSIRKGYLRIDLHGSNEKLIRCIDIDMQLFWSSCLVDKNPQLFFRVIKEGLHYFASHEDLTVFSALRIGQLLSIDIASLFQEIEDTSLDYANNNEPLGDTVAQFLNETDQTATNAAPGGLLIFFFLERAEYLKLSFFP
ncbi:hypothetical protein RFI_30582 [Reticulomyxa filosa]|uniref:Uncharacterized protein n=1 Tax=Reticulomyxa filosa TaxID=46433 RepID=X6LZN6_RETFI|nr:hypothetical protein RFI_30582 [Reticulomyxa filosa]|eukprot:ETO06811.1 hypothetical protein RFI_30582 [Reticulomyxa filosa]